MSNTTGNYMFGSKPNILLINCDDLGYGDIGCYGSKLNSTPVLDKLAGEGMRFTNFYASSPVCSPSRGSLLTGCWPNRIGFSSFEGKNVLYPGQGVGLNQSEITIAKLLKEANYSTMIVGKWHCGDQPEFLPLSHGFDSYYGLPYSNDMARQKGRNIETDLEMIKFRPPLPLICDNEVIEEQPDQRSLTERYVEHGVRFIRNNKTKPFFLYFAHMHVHLPLLAAERFVKQSKNGDYGACVEAIDWATDALVAELKLQGLYENTLIIFTSDNGSKTEKGGSNGPLRGTKATTWEGGMRVPGFFHWKGVIPEGIVSDKIFAQIDLFPTIAALAGIDIPNDRIIDGIDLSPIIFENTNKESTTHITDIDENDEIIKIKLSINRDKKKIERGVVVYYQKETLEAIRIDNWKLHFRKYDQSSWRNPVYDICNELYNLEFDAGETTNLFEKFPLIVKCITEHANEFRLDLGDAVSNILGENIREIGKVDNPDTLTHYNPKHPYIIAIYDTEDAG
jgi:arylsulfatase A-like enzyme